MDNERKIQIGSLVTKTVENYIHEDIGGYYTLQDFIDDFEGTQEQLLSTLIKIAAKHL